MNGLFQVKAKSNLPVILVIEWSKYSVYSLLSKIYHDYIKNAAYLPTAEAVAKR